MVKFSGGGMIVIIVFGIFGVVLCVIICCVFWLMIMICFEFCNWEEINGGDFLGEIFKKVILEGNFFVKLSFFYYFLVSGE